MEVEHYSSGLKPGEEPMEVEAIHRPQASQGELEGLLDQVDEREEQAKSLTGSLPARQ